MMGKGGKKKSNSNTYKYICKGAVNKALFILPSNYKYNYNLMYIKICARNKFQCFTK